MELADGPFLEINLKGVVPASEAVLWTVTIDGSLRLKTSAYAGGTQGILLTTEQYERGVTVVFAATDAAEVVIQSTGEVFVSR